MRRIKIAAILAGLLLVAAPQILAQPVGWDDGYNNYGKLTDTRVTPSGTVVEPGSQLLFILDTGVDANALFGSDTSFGSKSVSELGGVTAPAFQNFMSVTNTNPTDSVTVHFRYFNSECKDVLDFLVVMSCNDTLLVDPFDFIIPGSSINVAQRFYGAVSDTPVPAIPASQYGDGRFLLFVTSSGDPTDTDQVAETLFPFELVSSTLFSEWLDGDGVEDCPGVRSGTRGAAAGVRDNNLHILNASAISFDFLVGFYTIASPSDFGGNVAYGVRAIARPAVDLTVDAESDGDGPHIWKGNVLSGSEDIFVNQQIPPQPGDPVVNNLFYLRQEAHAGNKQAPGGNFVVSEGGALEWTLFPIAVGGAQGIGTTNQLVQFASLLDDYNGSNNVKGLAFQDYSYRMDPVVTIYNLTVYNNNEEPVDVPAPDVIISPPPEGEELTLVIAVKCLNAWTVGSDCPNQVVTNLQDFSVADLFQIGGTRVQSHLASPVLHSAGDHVLDQELGPGWVRFSRVVSTIRHSNPNCTTWTLVYDGVEPTIVTVGQDVLRFEGFGASWWLATSAYSAIP